MLVPSAIASGARALCRWNPSPGSFGAGRGGPARPGHMNTPRYESIGRSFTASTRTGWETVIILRGELDLATVGDFEAAYGSIDLSSVGRVVLDLRELDFIDARGLRSVLDLHERCLRHSAGLRVKPGPRRVHRVFELTGTDCVLQFVRPEPGQ